MMKNFLSKHKLVKSTLIVMVITGIGYILSFFSQILMANYFGASKDVDAFVAAKIIPDVLYGMVTVLFTTVFIMCFSKHLYSKKKKLVVFQNTFNIALVGSCVVVLLLILFAPYAAQLVAPGFDAERLHLTTQLIRVLALSVILLSLISLATGVLYSYHEFNISSLLKIFLPLGIILGIIVLGKRWGVISLALGTLVGVLITLIIQLYRIHQEGFTYRWRFYLKDKMFLLMLRLSWPLLISSLFFYLNRMVNTLFASTLEAGKVAALNYAFAIAFTPAILFSGSITTTLYPLFTQLHIKNDKESLHKMFYKSVKWTIFLLVPISIIFIFFGKFVIKLLFERGAFTSTNTTEVSAALAFYSIGLVAMGLNFVILNLLYAQQRIKIGMFLTILLFVVNVQFNFILIKPLSYVGLALGMSVAHWVAVMIILFPLRRYLLV